MCKDGCTAGWDPGQYLKYENERTRPATDLVRSIQMHSARRVLDVGCGPGNSTAVLRARWPQAELVGFDKSAAMLEKAARTVAGVQWVQGDMDGDLAGLGQFDVIFSNAALQWVPDNGRLLPVMLEMLRPGGVLAVQVPFSTDERRPMPSHTELQRLVDEPKWRGRFAGAARHPAYCGPGYYYDVLSGLGAAFDIWQTDYIHVMDSHLDIVAWNKGTALLPYLDVLPDDRLREEFLKDFGEAMKAAYPPQADGKVLYPFTRILFTAQKPEGRD